MILFSAAFIVVAAFVAVLRMRGSVRRLGPPSQAEVRRLLAVGEKIAAIKVYRELTGLDLRDSKEAVDRIHASGIWEAPAASAALPVAGDDAVLALVREKKIVEAVKLYREKHGVDLLAAKQAVDKLSKNAVTTANAQSRSSAD